MTKKEFPQLGEQYFEQRLPSGMMVRVVEKPGFAKKYAFVAVNFGSIDTKFRLNGVDYATPDGVAHYLEHKMFDLPEGNAMELFAQNAGSNNAFTSYAMTAYYVECTERFEENLSILLRLVTTPYFTEESVEKERGIIAQEIKMYDDSDGNVVQENLFRAMYLHHPARVSVAGTVESIQDITAKTLYDCHRAFYDPSNLILCVVGDVDAAKVLAQAERETPKESGGARLWPGGADDCGAEKDRGQNGGRDADVCHRLQVRAGGRGHGAAADGVFGLDGGGAAGGRIVRALHAALRAGPDRRGFCHRL